ncbi:MULTISPECIES: hypothetical protein [Paenibacillus]|uniref:hypothetical protein n=1 Tax=Paenibacillus TaxID=44249 RepID=UPI00117D8E11|nr:MULTISPECIES: hypothetical protein [Paenibacillus]MDH6442464.1 hypothetical protein [Paenibacillus sp. PastF-4]
MEDPTLFFYWWFACSSTDTAGLSGGHHLRLVLTDPDGVIRKLLAFGALFRTQATLFTQKRNVSGAFSVNSDCGVR